MELDGAHLRPCEEGEPENAAIGCSRILTESVVLPGYGDARDRAAILQSLRALYSHVDLTITDQRPPLWLPHTMSVVGGSSSLLDVDPGTCGWAPLTCGGRQRNRINFTFPFACTSRVPDRIAAVIAQESGHNFGLEHTDSLTDVMYPTLTEDLKTFEDRCTPIIPTNEAVACPEEHAEACPDTEGESQNAHLELLQIFGPRFEDTEPPVIRTMFPDDGAVFGPGETILLTATLHEASGAVGVRWSFTEGPEATLEAAGRDRCTNGVCRWPYGNDTPLDADWHFVELVEPEIGRYGARLELMDMDGNYTSREIHFEVREEVGTTGGPVDTGDGEPPGDTGGTPGDGSGGPGEPEPAPTNGCACGVAPGSTTLWTGLALWPVFAGLRRRTGPKARRSC